MSNTLSLLGKAPRLIVATRLFCALAILLLNAHDALQQSGRFDTAPLAVACAPMLKFSVTCEWYGTPQAVPDLLQRQHPMSGAVNCIRVQTKST